MVLRLLQDKKGLGTFPLDNSKQFSEAETKPTRGQGIHSAPQTIIEAPARALEYPAKVLRPFHYVFQWIIGAAFALAIIFVLIIAGLVFFNISQTGVGQTAYKHGEVALKDTPIAATLKIINPKLANLIVPGQAGEISTEYSFESEIIENAENKNLGVKVTSFKQYRPTLEGEDIEVIASLEGASLDQDTEINVFCSLEDYQKGELIPASLAGSNAQGNKALIPKGDSSILQASCFFPGGLDIDAAIAAKEAKLVVLFDFKTKALYEFSFINDAELSALQLSNRDPFEVHSELPKTKKSITTAGPVNLGIGSLFPTPWTNRGTRRVDISLTNGPDWRGHLKVLKELNIYIPSLDTFSIILEGEEGFPQQGINSRCDFQFTGQEEEGFNIYTLKDPLLQKVNQDCDASALKDSTLSQLQCFDIYKEPTYGCIFVIDNLPPQGRGSDYILASAVYTYQIDARTTVTITKQPGSFGADKAVDELLS